MKTRNSLSKSTKRLVETILDSKKRGEYLRLMLMAERESLIVPRFKNTKSKDDNQIDS